MNALFAVLLVLTVCTSVALMLSMIPRGRPVLRGGTAVRLIGLGQLAVGALWVAFGAGFLHERGSHDGRGWYAVVLGLLWVWQATRRLASPRLRR